jgi:hypothetical protein
MQSAGGVMRNTTGHNIYIDGTYTFGGNYQNAMPLCLELIGGSAVELLRQWPAEQRSLQLWWNGRVGLGPVHYWIVYDVTA